jgi:hypothetical protein
VPGEGGVGESGDDFVDPAARHVRGPHHAQRLGADVPVLPRGARPLHGRHDLRGLRAYPGAGNEHRTPHLTCREGRGQHRADAVGAEDGFGLGAPGGALFGQGAGFVLGLPGLEVGLLGQRPGLDRGGGTVVLTLELGRQLGLAVFDGRATLRPAGVQRRVDADEFMDRALARVGGGSFGEPDRQGLREAAF